MSDEATWSRWADELRRLVEDQLASADFAVWVGGAADRGQPIQVRVRAGDVDRHALADLLEPGGSNALLLTAEAGAGKTTLVLRLVLAALDSRGASVPLLFQLGLWDGEQDLLDLAGGAELSGGEVDVALRTGGHLVVLDAVDEIQADDLENPCKHLIAFVQRRYPNNTFVITARTAEVPSWFTRSFRQAEVLPLEMSEVEQHLVRLLEKQQRRIASTARPRLIELCRNPLILSMALRVFSPDNPEFDELRSRSALYQQFLRSIEAREAEKAGARDGWTDEDELRAAVLRKLSSEMQRRGVFFADATDVAEWLGDAARENAFTGLLPPTERWSGHRLAELAARRPPLKRVRAGLGHERYAFLHSTFRDVYVAQYLLRGESADFDTKDALLDTSRTLWPVFVHMAGLSEGPSEFLNEVVRIAVEHERQELFILAADCFADRWDAPRGEADELAIRILDAFKNWQKPFDYHLMRAGEYLLLSTTRGFPARLKDDLRYFLDKYAKFVPIALESTRDSILRAALSDADETMVCNAAHTVLDRYDPADDSSEMWINALLGARNAPSAMVREQITAVLKEIASRDSLAHARLRDEFRQIAANDESTPIERVYGLQGLSACGTPQDFEVFRGALLNHEFPFRDSASWALQIYARRFQASDQELIAKTLEVYQHALDTETDDSTGAYAKGNILYSIGALGDPSLREVVEAFLENEQDPYVIEDGVNCLGLLGQPESAPFILGLLRHDDPVVRMKALEALGRCGNEAALDAIRQMTNDPITIVQEAATAALNRLRRSEGEEHDQDRARISWPRVKELLLRAEPRYTTGRRSSQSVIIQNLPAEDVALLREAIIALRARDASCPDAEIRGTEGRQAAVLRNSLRAALSALVEEMLP